MFFLTLESLDNFRSIFVLEYSIRLAKVHCIHSHIYFSTSTSCHSHNFSSFNKLTENTKICIFQTPSKICWIKKEMKTDAHFLKLSKKYDRMSSALEKTKGISGISKSDLITIRFSIHMCCLPLVCSIFIIKKNTAEFEVF